MRRWSPAVPPSIGAAPCWQCWSAATSRPCPRPRVLAVRPCYGDSLGDTHLRNVDGVVLYGDDFAMPGDAVLVRLQTCAVDARGALRFALPRRRSYPMNAACMA